jgi:phenylalanyl-tRNA synthetase alpha chain
MDPQEALRVLEQERRRGLERFAEAGSTDELEAAKVAVLGRRSPWSQVQRSLGGLGVEEKRRLGRLSNEVKAELEEALERRRAVLVQSDETRLLQADRVDVTLPGRRPREGSLHPRRRSSRSSPGWGTGSRRAPRSKTTGTTSRR